MGVAAADQYVRIFDRRKLDPGQSFLFLTANACLKSLQERTITTPLKDHPSGHEAGCSWASWRFYSLAYDYDVDETAIANTATAIGDLLSVGICRSLGAGKHAVTSFSFAGRQQDPNLSTKEVLKVAPPHLCMRESPC